MYSLSLGFAFPNQKIPIFYVYSGRIYKDACFNNTIGEFIDLVPLLIDTGKKDSIFQKINIQLEFVRKHNINIASFIYENKIALQYPNMTRLLKKIEINDIPIFNYIGQFSNVNIVEKNARNDGGHMIYPKFLTEVFYTKNVITSKVICMLNREGG